MPASWLKSVWYSEHRCLPYVGPLNLIWIYKIRQAVLGRWGGGCFLNRGTWTIQRILAPEHLSGWNGKARWLQTRWLKMTDVSSLTVLKARNPKSRCWQDPTPSDSSRGESSLPLPASGGSRWSLACGHFTPSSASLWSHRHLPFGVLVLTSLACVL